MRIARSAAMRLTPPKAPVSNPAAPPPAPWKANSTGKGRLPSYAAGTRMMKRRLLPVAWMVWAPPGAGRGAPVAHRGLCTGWGAALPPSPSPASVAGVAPPSGGVAGGGAGWGAPEVPPVPEGPPPLPPVPALPAAPGPDVPPPLPPALAASGRAFPGAPGEGTGAPLPSGSPWQPPSASIPTESNQPADGACEPWARLLPRALPNAGRPYGPDLACRVCLCRRRRSPY